jgi:hypothetical protein
VDGGVQCSPANDDNLVSCWVRKTHLGCRNASAAYITPNWRSISGSDHEDFSKIVPQGKIVPVNHVYCLEVMTLSDSETKNPGDYYEKGTERRNILTKRRRREPSKKLHSHHINLRVTSQKVIKGRLIKDCSLDYFEMGGWTKCKTKDGNMQTSRAQLRRVSRSTGWKKTHVCA